MAKLNRNSLMTLEAYASQRNAFRAEVIAHKKDRNVALGDHVTLLFEDEMTIRYQVQEMLRARKKSSRRAASRTNSTLTTRSSPMAATGRPLC